MTSVHPPHQQLNGRLQQPVARAGTYNGLQMPAEKEEALPVFHLQPYLNGRAVCMEQGLCSIDHALAELREDLSWSRRLRMIVGDESGRAKLAQGIAECLHKTGACVVQDPRVQPRSGVLCWDAPRAVQACCVHRIRLTAELPLLRLS